MKDALGHGSDPRGAHQAGVDQIGQARKPGQVVRVNEHHSYRTIPSAIPGLSYTKTQISSSKYFTLDHDASGKQIANFMSGPVGEKDKAFMNHIDSVVRPIGIDWTKSEGELSHALSPEKAAHLRNAISTATTKGDDQRIRIRKS